MDFFASYLILTIFFGMFVLQDIGILKKIEARIKLMDSRPGFNPEEKETCQELKKP